MSTDKEGPAIQLCLRAEPLETKWADRSIPVGIGAHAAFALFLKRIAETPLHLPGLAEECDDFGRTAIQLLLETRSQEQYEKTLKDLLEDMVNRKEPQLHRAVEQARDMTQEYFHGLPAVAAATDDEAPSPLPLFSRPDDTPGTWCAHSCEMATDLADICTDGADEYRVLRNNLIRQKKTGWAQSSFPIHVGRDTLPAAHVDAQSGVLSVASVTPDYKYVRVQVFRQAKSSALSDGPDHSFCFTLPEQDDYSKCPKECVLQLDVLDGTLFAVSFSRGVLVYDLPNDTSVMHVIGHPRFQAIDRRMITAVLLKSPTELVLGTALGCLWNVHPLDPTVTNSFLALPKVVPIRVLRYNAADDQQTLIAITVTEVYLQREDAEFIRMVQSFRALDAWIHNNALFTLCKNGCIIYYDLKQEKSPEYIPPPAEQPTSRFICPWYAGLRMTPNGQFLEVLYADGLCTLYKMF